MTHYIEITNLKYVPASLTINLGDKVVWKNKDSMAHTATRTESPAKFDTGGIDTNEESVAITFSEISDSDGFTYHCKPHPFMKGTIKVNAISLT